MGGYVEVQEHVTNPFSERYFLTYAGIALCTNLLQMNVFIENVVVGLYNMYYDRTGTTKAHRAHSGVEWGTPPVRTPCAV